MGDPLFSNHPVQDDGGAWCSTEVNRRGEYVDRKWGVCSNRCPGKKSKSIFQTITAECPCKDDFFW